MATQRYSVTPHPIETLLTWVKSGEIAMRQFGERRAARCLHPLEEEREVEHV